jgi:hypothetical protein
MADDKATRRLQEASGNARVLGALGMVQIGWHLVSGSVGVLLGVMIWRQYPLSGAWAVGTLVGVYLIMGGWGVIRVPQWPRPRWPMTGSDVTNGCNVAQLGLRDSSAG